MKKCDIRVGYGHDVHRLVKGRKLILGGVDIPHKTGLDGHSDADVLLHAVCDALLGAAGFEDIGHRFPNTDPKYKNISSLILLAEVYKLISKKKWIVGNVDSMILLEEPKVYPFIPEMKKKHFKNFKDREYIRKSDNFRGTWIRRQKTGMLGKRSCIII